MPGLEPGLGREPSGDVRLEQVARLDVVHGSPDQPRIFVVRESMSQWIDLQGARLDLREIEVASQRLRVIQVAHEHQCPDLRSCARAVGHSSAWATGALFLGGWPVQPLVRAPGPVRTEA